MSTFMKILLVPALVVAFSVGVAIAASGGDDPSSPLANVAPATSTLDTTTSTTTEVDDISGPCDETEHANDPRCTGNGEDRDDDSSGPGRGDDDHGDDDRGDDDDNSGPGSQSSGPGHDDDDHDDDDDRSGPGGGDEDDDDDRSGHGGGEDEDDR